MVPPRRPAADTTIPPPAVANTVRTLEQVLKPKPPRGFSPCKSSYPPSDVGGDLRQADAATTLKSQEPSTTGASSAWEIPVLPNDMPSSTVLQGGQIQAPQYITASTSGTDLSRTDAAVALKPLGSSTADTRSFPSLHMASANVACESNPQQTYVYNTHLFSSSSGYPQPHPPRQRLSLPSSAASSAMSPNYLQAQSTEDSCTVVAPGLISVMAGLEAHSVRGQLDYMHDTASFGNVVDRYTTATTMGI